MKIKNLLIILILTGFTPACGGNLANPNSNLQPSEIREPEIGETYEELSTQEEKINNCDGMNPTTTFRRSLEQGQTTVFEIVVEAGGLLRGTPIPEVLQFELESRLKSALQRANILSDIKMIEIPLSTPKGEAWKHTITWREKKVRGIIEVLYQDKAAKISFQRIINFQLEDRTSEPLNCGSQIETADTPEVITPPLYKTPIPQNVFSFSETDLNNMLGVNNWHCIDGSPNAVSIEALPANFLVQSPFERIDTQSGFYFQGETVPATGYATGWLSGNLPNNKCSSERIKVTREIIDSLLGIGNWQCLKQYPTGVLIKNVPTGYTVKSPVILVDKDNNRYYQDESVPASGTATIWFSENIPSDLCP